jgi:hypothetical protein
VTLEERILRMIPVLDLPPDRNELRAIAIDARKLEDRVKQLESKVDELHDLEKWLEGR